MSHKAANLRFNFGHLLHAVNGTSRTIELDYDRIRVAEDVTLSPLQGAFQATRTSKGIYVEGELETTMDVECSRCLEAIPLAITVELGDLFYYPPPAPPGEYAVGEDGFVDLAPIVRENSLLGIPTQPMCREGCAGLCAQCGQNFNHGLCDCKVDEIDPRLAVLKKLLDEGE